MWLSPYFRAHSFKQSQSSKDSYGQRSRNVTIMAFWHDSGPSRRSSQVDTRRWNPENNALARCM
eukprot:275004-Pyramimonas_sp.AAC.1